MPQTTTLEELDTSFPVLPHTGIEATVLLLLVVTWAIAWKIRDLTRLPHDHPPLVRSGIPWLGHAIPFLKDNSGLVEQVKSKYPDHGIITLLLAGRYLYLVTDTAHAAQIFRQSKNFAFDPLVLAVSTAFGCDESDIKIIRRGTCDSDLKERPSDLGGKEDEKPGILSKLHHMSASNLMGDSLDRMTAAFIDTFTNGINAQFPADQESSFEWQELELVDFIKNQWTLASIVSLFGSNILNIWPDVAEWIWEFDTQVPLLMTGLAEWGIFPAAFRAREEALGKFEMWEKEAKTQSQKTNLDSDVEWDSFWGLKFLRERAGVAEEYGLSARGRAAVQLALFWGQNANAIPCASWLTVQALTNPTLFPHLLTEIKNATPSLKDPTKIDIPTLLKQPRLKSLLQEVYRWTTSSPCVRVVQQDTKVGDYLLLKGNIVMIHARSLQLDPKIWPNAEQFNASRFLEPDTIINTPSQSTPSKPTDDETKKQKLQSQSMRAFGGGQNLCPGRHFATNEILCGFAVLMNLLEMEVVESVFEARGRPEVELGDGKQGGLWLDRGVRVKVRRRRVLDVAQ